MILLSVMYLSSSNMDINALVMSYLKLNGHIRKRGNK